MKNLTTLIGALLFSTFFYQQNIGLNLLLFTLITILILTINNSSAFTRRETIIKAIAYLITGITVFLYNSNLAIIANVIGFFTLVGSVSEHKSSIYIKWINGVYTTIVAAFAKHFESLESEKKNIKKKKINYVYWLKMVGIPAVVLIVFITLYRNGNPMFDKLIAKIDLSFINLQWILLTGLGYYLFYNISNPIQIEPVTVVDISTGNILGKNSLKEQSEEKLENEKQLGVILMFLLNLLIVFFLITDVLYLSEIHTMTSSQLSQQVHNGVNALIASILLAIVIIIYFFRGNLNFVKENKNLKSLTYIWIFLNLNLVLITAIKNYEYISSFGFTYKRMGVLIYLFLTSIGLITTFLKVYKIKNLWFLFRKNAQIAFAILIISATINWDKIITIYNINYAEKTDVLYLINLSNNNTLLLKEYAENNEINFENEFDVNTKYNNYINNLNSNSWQEMVYDNLIIKE